MNAQFILGFIAGEGSFSFKSVERGRFNFYIQPEFSLNVKERDVLDHIIEEVGFGYNYDLSKNGMSTWRISSREGRLKLIEFIDEHAGPLFKSTKKYESYLKWKELVERKPELLKTRDGVKEMVSLAYAINERERSRPTKRSKEEVFEIIDNAERHTCGVDASNGPCGNIVSSPDDVCHRHS